MTRTRCSRASRSTRPLWPHWSASAGLSAEQEYILQEDVGRGYDLIGIPVALKYDSSNNALEPTKGIRAALELTPTHSLAGDSATFLTMQASASTYLDLSGNGRSVVALRGLLGQIAGAGHVQPAAGPALLCRWQHYGAGLSLPVGGAAIRRRQADRRHRDRRRRDRAAPAPVRRTGARRRSSMPAR